jgi:hypothetical protein
MTYRFLILWIFFSFCFDFEKLQKNFRLNPFRNSLQSFHSYFLLISIRFIIEINCENERNIRLWCFAGVSEKQMKEKPSRTLFVRNISYDTREEDLRQLFEQYGPVRKIFNLIRKRGMAFVTFVHFVKLLFSFTHWDSLYYTITHTHNLSFSYSFSSFLLLIVCLNECSTIWDMQTRPNENFKIELSVIVL